MLVVVVILQSVRYFAYIQCVQCFQETENNVTRTLKKTRREVTR